MRLLTIIYIENLRGNLIDMVQAETLHKLGLRGYEGPRLHRRGIAEKNISLSKLLDDHERSY